MARWSKDRNIAATKDPWDSLRRELDRARRYGRPLALIQISGGASDAGRRRRFRRGDGGDAATLEFLRSFVRAGDEVWRDRDRIFVMLPEADPACASGMVDRLRTRAASVLAGADVRLASFPEHGLTAVALLEELSQSREPAKRFATRRVIAEDARLRAG